MIKIIDKEQCCGCTACYNVCPQKAICMKPDNEGFLYPEVDLEECINCGACDKVCPMTNRLLIKRDLNGCYIVRSKEDEILMNSTSGGFITPLIIWILSIGGVACAASYNNEFKVKHSFIEKNQEEELSNIRGSKYVQSNLDDCFVKVKGYLEQKKMVCFVGTPCQICGLKTFLKKDYEELITVDLVCHGVPSPKLWEKYLEYQKNKYHSEICKVSFRNKTYGYHSGTMEIRFANGKCYHGSARIDYMLKSFFKEIASRPICYKCPFKTIEHYSDFTIYDCWHAAELVQGLKDDDKGYTNLIVWSVKGEEIFKQIRQAYEIYPVEVLDAIKLDGKMILENAIPHPQRFEFYHSLDRRTLQEQIQKYIPINTCDYIIEYMKGVCHRLGIYQIAKKIFKR